MTHLHLLIIIAYNNFVRFSFQVSAIIAEGLLQAIKPQSLSEAKSSTG